LRFKKILVFCWLFSHIVKIFNNKNYALLPGRLKLLLVCYFLGLRGATFRVVPPIDEGGSYGYSGISSSNKSG